MSRSARALVVLAAALVACDGHTDLLGTAATDAASSADAKSHDASARRDGSSDGGEAGSTRGGPVITPCTPGDQVPCECTTVGRTGHQVCNALGTAYGPCMNGDPLPRDAGPVDGFDASRLPQCQPACVAPEVCATLPGTGEPRCGPACHSNKDCPSWLTCAKGICSQCDGDGACPVGEECDGVFEASGPDSASYSACVPCSQPDGCTSCSTSAQCAAGEVCSGQRCTQCSTDTECGPLGHCTGTHTGTQCTCASDADCASGDSCQAGVCTPVCCSNADCAGTGGSCTNGVCFLGAPSNEECGGRQACAKGQACIGGFCSACTTFEDCVEVSEQDVSTVLACIDGKCAPCTANAQCGGGQACVGGTCGTCATHSECGPSGQCTSGFCTCTADTQCASGERCGAGVCVPM